MKRMNYLAKLWTQAPLSWAIIRANECELLAKQNFVPPILEVGCGDGLVTQIIFAPKHKKIDVGIDLNSHEIRRAEKRGIYKKLLVTDITQAPFPNNSFNTIFANGVLEHIPDLDKALKEIHRLLIPGGFLLTTSPTPVYSQLLAYSRLCNFLGLPYLANAYAHLINRFFAHRHLLSEFQWQKKLKSAGFKIVSCKYYNNQFAIFWHDICLPFSILTPGYKKMTDQMALFRNLRQFFVYPIAPQINRWLLNQNPDPEKNASVFIVAQKI